MGARKDGAVRVPHPGAITGAAVEQALTGMGAQLLFRAPDGTVFSARTGATIWSFGEQITVNVQEDGAGTTLVQVSSEASQLVDWGKNAQNLEQFHHGLLAALAVVSASPAASARPVQPRPASQAASEAPQAAPEPPPRAEATPSVPAPPPPAAGQRVFVSYRREDSGTSVGRICDRLTLEFGAANVFKDVDSIPFGVDFVEYLDHEVEQCTVLFAVIGPRWLDAGPHGARRIDDPNDFVRIEIASALRRRIPVVPLLVDGARLPRADELPEELQALARRNGTEIRHDPDFHSDMSRLLSRLGGSRGRSPQDNL